MMSENESNPSPSPGEPPQGMVVYRSPDGRSHLTVRLQGQTAWLTQAQMAELFQTTPQNITMHVANIFDEGELVEEATCKDYLQVRTEGTRQVARATKHYSLEVIIAVGYRVRSERGTQFRQWATTVLSEFMTKGFALDDERLKEAKHYGRDYFDELLSRVRDIRASERRFYQKITDIYATSIDYDGAAVTTRAFFATVQNKLHWAIHGHTAAEIVIGRADADKPNMGLTTWKNAPGGAVRRTDVTVAKNYLSSEEIDALNRVVTMYLDYAEDQAKRQIAMHMADWVKKLDGFLAFNERNILSHAGKVTKELADEHAAREFEKFDRARLDREASEPTGDFDKFVEQSRQLKPQDKPKTAKKPKKKGD